MLNHPSNINPTRSYGNLMDTYAPAYYESGTSVRDSSVEVEAAEVILSDSGKTRRYIKSINNIHIDSGNVSPHTTPAGKLELSQLVAKHRALAIRAANEENTEIENMRLHREIDRIKSEINEADDRNRLSDIEEKKKRIVAEKNEYEEKKADVIDNGMVGEMMSITKKAMIGNAKTLMRTQANQSPHKVLALV